MAMDDGPDLDAIIALESRITAALDRIAGAAAVNAVAAQSAGPDPRVADLEAQIETLKTDLAEAQAAAGAGSGLDPSDMAPDQGTETELLRQKAERLRSERNAIRDERDALAEELDRYRSGVEGGPAGLLSALRDLRRANADLRSECETLRQAAVAGADAPSPDTLNAAMAAELLSLRAERAADAAEMRLILDELTPMTQASGAADA